MGSALLLLLALLVLQAVMDCYKLLASTVLGLHSVHVVSGR